jgi:signal transduction histidine kinase
VEHEQGEDGCGTAPACMVCGAARALSDAAQGADEPLVRDCRILTRNGGPRAHDLRAHVTHIAVGGDDLYVVSLLDVSAEKRRRVLERTFFHDVLNTAGGLRGLAEMLTEEAELPPGEAAEIRALIQQSSIALVEEIEHQRQLLAAEAGDLECDWQDVDASHVLDQVRDLYTRHPVGEGRTIRVSDLPGATLRSDRVLLVRTLGNLTKNALEATPPGAEVTLDATADAEEIVFSVHNPGAMPVDVQKQVFKRSFSTKAAAGRGIGTWSVKLFTEAYLGGAVDFRSTPEEGTTFFVRLPVHTVPEQ